MTLTTNSNALQNQSLRQTRFGDRLLKQCRHGRRYVIVISAVLGAILTTPEVITQILMAVPLYLLYEITVWIAWYWERQDRKREALNETLES